MSQTFEIHSFENNLEPQAQADIHQIMGIDLASKTRLGYFLTNSLFKFLGYILTISLFQITLKIVYFTK